MWNLGYCATDFNGHGGGMHDAVLTLTGSCGFLLSVKWQCPTQVQGFCLA